ncbi:MAG: GntR family transcriptional regulator [Lachnospiraceae bacterium]|nr:GntR family transcriptional regulator [Lachnospiraceae bacterium]
MIVLDLRDKRPIYEQVVEKLSQLIVCGVLEADSKLPSVRSLAIDLSVNPNTIQRAYAQLEQDGYLYTITGRGNFVAESSSWKKGRMTLVENDLRQALKEARQTGMSRESVESIVSEIWTDADKSNEGEE